MFYGGGNLQFNQCNGIYYFLKTGTRQKYHFRRTILSLLIYELVKTFR